MTPLLKLWVDEVLPRGLGLRPRRHAAARQGSVAGRQHRRPRSLRTAPIRTTATSSTPSCRPTSRPRRWSACASCRRCCCTARIGSAATRSRPREGVRRAAGQLSRLARARRSCGVRSAGRADVGAAGGGGLACNGAGAWVSVGRGRSAMSSTVARAKAAGRCRFGAWLRLVDRRSGQGETCRLVRRARLPQDSTRPTRPAVSLRGRAGLGCAHWLRWTAATSTLHEAHCARGTRALRSSSARMTTTGHGPRRLRSRICL